MWCSLRRMRLFNHAILLFLLLVLLMVFSVPFSASAKAKSPLRAVMMLKTAPEMSETTTLALKGYLADLAVDLLVESSENVPHDFDAQYVYFAELASERKADIVFYIDFSAATYATLYVCLPESGTTLIRHIDCSEETPEGRFEVVGVIIRGLLAAMSTGGEIGIHIPEVAEPPTPVQENTPESDSVDRDACVSGPVSARPLVRFGVKAGYGLGIASRDIPVVHNFRLAVGAKISVLRIFAAYRVTMPMNKEDEQVSLSLYPHPISLGVGYEKSFSKWTVLLGLEGIVDPLSWKIVPKSDTALPETGHLTIRGTVTPFFLADWTLSTQTSLYLGVSLDIYVYQPTYNLRVDGQAVPFLSLWTFSPFVQIGVGFGLGT